MSRLQIPVSQCSSEKANENDAKADHKHHSAFDEPRVSALYQRIPSYFNHSDPRGAITGLLNFGSWKEMNFITSVADTVRGRHYHKETEECFFILTGRIKVTFRKPIEGGKDLSEQTIFEAGDVFRVFPMVEHTFEVLEDSQWINLLSCPLDKDNPDFHRYP